MTSKQLWNKQFTQKMKIWPCCSKPVWLLCGTQRKDFAPATFLFIYNKRGLGLSRTQKQHKSIKFVNQLLKPVLWDIYRDGIYLIETELDVRIHGRIGEENYCGWPDLLIQSVSHPKLSDGFGRLWIKHLYFFTFRLLCKWWQNVHFWVKLTFWSCCIVLVWIDNSQPFILRTVSSSTLVHLLMAERSSSVTSSEVFFLCLKVWKNKKGRSVKWQWSCLTW